MFNLGSGHVPSRGKSKTEKVWKNTRTFVEAKTIASQ
jgi:hypothetical protein